MPLRALAPDLWIADDAMPIAKGFMPVAIPSFLGRATIRMTVVRLSSGGLVLHSPVQPSPALVDEVHALGPVQVVVAPCVMHTTYLRPWSERFPAAKAFVAPRTKKRVPALADVPELDDDAPIAPDCVEQVFMAGHRNYETLFLHRPSKTLIATDLVYNLAARAGLGERAWFRLAGVTNPLGVTRYSRRAVTNADLFSERLRRVLAWDFDRVVMSHGDVVESGGKALFTRAWSEHGP